VIPTSTMREEKNPAIFISTSIDGKFCWEYQNVTMQSLATVLYMKKLLEYHSLVFGLTNLHT